MKSLQTMTSNTNLMKTNASSENLPSGESISKAIFMGNKNCCGAAYVERV